MELDYYETLVCVCDLVTHAKPERKQFVADTLNKILTAPLWNILELYQYYKKEFETTILTKTTDSKGRGALISKHIKLLNYSIFFENNKEILFDRQKNYYNQTKYIVCSDPTKKDINSEYYGFLFELFHVLQDIERDIKRYCFDFNLNYSQLIKNYELYNKTVIYDLGELGYYNVYGTKRTQQPETKEPNPLTPPEQTIFKSLFVAPYCLDKKINELKNILETKNFTVKGQWRGITRKKNELAYLYHYLKSNPGVIMTGDFKEQIKVFYDEFGLTVKDKLEPGVLTVTKNLTQYSTRTDTYKNFERLFIQWVQ